MPNVPVVTARKLVNVLKKKGFVLQRTTGSHFIYVKHEGKLRASVPVHQGRDLGRGITRDILSDAGISIEEFLALL